LRAREQREPAWNHKTYDYDDDDLKVILMDEGVYRGGSVNDLFSILDIK
jgi:hypothetical protein